uniref:Phytanoyl-CoA dioxygenase n=1 Tax=uncultured Armatimonadetes bacterium TaxID=157466 RepID=A0A6J4IDI2_9BACT|nr:Phytanoyl-CoA dioxygenase [uncultured Armatimonadetes bacterium]
MTDDTPQNPLVPDQGELKDVARDLRFFPSVVRDGTVLSAAQVEAFNRDGYLKGIRIFDETEISGHRAYLDALLARVLAAGGSSYSIATAHLRYGPVYDLLTHPRIVACVRDLLGPNVVGWGAHYFCKMPRDNKPVLWHQDAVYWPLTPSKTVTVWLAIDDADVENACMRFIEGSHRFGPVTHLPSEAAEDNVLNLKVEDAERYGRAVDDVLRAGEVSLHNDLLLHGSEANTSDRRRCGLTLRYCAAEVRAILGWHKKGVVVSGEDPDGHWANAPRPEDDPPVDVTPV